jgi:hypothetical protein
MSDYVGQDPATQHDAAALDPFSRWVHDRVPAQPLATRDWGAVEGVGGTGRWRGRSSADRQLVVCTCNSIYWLYPRLELWLT